MNPGETLFAMMMEFVPWKTFGCIIERHKGDSGVRALGRGDLFRIMAFSLGAGRCATSKLVSRPIRSSYFTWDCRAAGSFHTSSTVRPASPPSALASVCLLFDIFSPLRPEEITLSPVRIQGQANATIGPS